MREMDIVQKVFFFLGAILGASFLLVTFFVLGTAENGMLTVEGMSHLSDSMESFYHFAKWFVYIWMIAAAIMLFRFLKGLFGR